MRRLSVLGLCVTLVVLAGCGNKYAARMDKYVERLNEQKKLNYALKPMAKEAAAPCR